MRYTPSLAVTVFVAVCRMTNMTNMINERCLRPDLTARGGHPARETRLSRFRPSRGVLPAVPNSTDRRALTAGALLLATVLFPRLAIADVKTIGPLSFAVPDGWVYETSAPDRADMVWKNSNGAYLIILLTVPQPTSGDADRDFAIAWRALVEKDPRMALPSPIYDVRGSVGYAARWSGGAVANRTREVALYVLQPGGGTFVPVMVVGPNRAVLDALYETVRMVIGSVRIAPLRAAPLKTTIGVADLVGDWKTGGASVVSYVNGSTGTYAGTSVTFAGDYYSIAADGRYSYRFQGLSSGSVIRAAAAGTVEFGGEWVVFHERPSDKLTRYRFVSYEQGLTGATLMTLLPEAYPITGSNIALYAARFVREAPAK